MGDNCTKALADTNNDSQHNTNSFGVLLVTTQNLRTHWSGVIVSQIGYAITLNIAIWGFFLKEYLDKNKSEGDYIFYAALLSSIAILLWRWYTHYLDKAIMGLYPEMIFYEAQLGATDDMGTWGYLGRNVFKKVEDKLSSEQKKHVEALKPIEKKKFIKALIDNKKIGSRGHNTIDIISLIFILITWLISIWLSYCWLSIVFLILCTFFFTFILCYYFQKNPSKIDFEGTICTSKGEN